MSNNKTFKLVIPPGFGYPQIVPARRTTSKSGYPWGRKVQPIVSVGAGDSYFELRSRPAPARTNEQRYDEQSESYPKIINPFMREDI